MLIVDVPTYSALCAPILLIAKQLELYQCLESVLGSLTWEGAPTWRGVVVSRDVERHFGVRVDAAREVYGARHLLGTLVVIGS